MQDHAFVTLAQLKDTELGNFPLLRIEIVALRAKFLPSISKTERRNFKLVS